MRLGCGGCLSTLLTLTAVGVLSVATGWAVVRSLQTPAVERVSFAPEDGARAQRKLLDLVRGRPRGGPVVLSEAEINAFVSRHLDPADLPLREPVIRLRDAGGVDITGTVPLERLLHESPLGSLTDVLPTHWTARVVWLSVSARARTTAEPRRSFRLDTRRLAIGRQRVPTILLRLLIDPARLGLTRIALPPAVRTVRVESGRVVIETTSPPPRT